VSNVEVVTKAIGGVRGPRPLSMTGTPGSRILDASAQSAEGAFADTETLWDFCADRGIGPPDFVKADIEGSEVEMVLSNPGWFTGAQTTFAIASYHVVDGVSSATVLEPLFQELGYVVWTVSVGHKTTLARPRRG
jgi:hypothetical protein